MRQFRRLAAVVAVLTGAAVAADADDKKPKKEPTSVRDIMKEGHAGKKSLLNQIKTGVKAEKWDAVEKPAAKFKEFGEDLGRNDPDKGDKASWEKLTKAYKEVTADIAEGVEKKDAKAANAALAKLGKSCKACHDAHKE